MSRKDFEKLSIAASNYWEKQFKSKSKNEDQQSTNCSFQQTTEKSILEISAQKAEEYLFPIEEKILPKEECISIEEDQSSMIDDDSNLEVSSSVFQESEQQNAIRRSRTQSNRRKSKKRFTNQENAFIMENLRQGKDFNYIAQQIPGTTISQIKRHFIRRLKVYSKSSGVEGDHLGDTMIRIQLLLEDQTKSNVTKVQELRLLVSDIEQHLQQTKKLILEKYLTLFQQ